MTVDDAIQRLVRTIHDHPVRTVLVTAGAGSQALADLLAVGGASRTLVEGVIPYSQAALTIFLASLLNNMSAKRPLACWPAALIHEGAGWKAGRRR